MDTNYIEFKKQRELGDILSDTFAFLRTQFKPFLSTFLKIVGPYLVIMLIAYTLFFNSFSSIWNSIWNLNVNSSKELLDPFMLMLSVCLFFGATITVYVMSQATTLFYIKAYTKNKGSVNFEEIKEEVYASFWSFIGLGILVSLSIGIGMLFFFVPGIYLLVPLYLSFSILVFDKKDVGSAYSDSFTLVKGHWWRTFAYILVVGIIVSVTGTTFNLPVTIYGWVKMGVFSNAINPTSISENLSDPIYILLNLVSVLFKFILNLISIIAGVFIYFDLNEKKNFTGTYDRIKNLGETTED